MSEKTKAEERRDFIRRHASRIDAARVALLSEERSSGLLFDAKKPWELARELWDAKPEDC